MTPEDVYTQLSAHLVKGLMVHDQFASYYLFLGMPGYSACHRYHFMSENIEYENLNRYYIEHFNKLIPPFKTEDPKIIPDAWHKYSRKDVDSNTKKGAVKTGMTSWVKWERDTKKLYETMSKELFDMGEIASYIDVADMVVSVDIELAEAEAILFSKEASVYDISDIMNEQESYLRQYTKKLSKLF